MSALAMSAVDIVRAAAANLALRSSDITELLGAPQPFRLGGTLLLDELLQISALDQEVQLVPRDVQDRTRTSLIALTRLEHELEFFDGTFRVRSEHVPDPCQTIDHATLSLARL